MHDDQHGTAVICLAAVINGLKMLKKEPKDMKLVINGAGYFKIINILVLQEQLLGNYFMDMVLLISYFVILRELFMRVDLKI